MFRFDDAMLMSYAAAATRHAAAVSACCRRRHGPQRYAAAMPMPAMSLLPPYARRAAAFAIDTLC